MPSELGNRLRNERKTRDMTQKDVAARFGITQSSYSRWENGISPPHDDQFAEVAAYIGVTTGEVWQMVYDSEEPVSLKLLQDEMAALRRQMTDMRKQALEIRELQETVAQLEGELEQFGSRRRRAKPGS
jgi:transcriptional regulator with XRE-family HTH domain